MTTEQLLPLLGFVTVMTATPGPNNLMLMASGANAGFRRSLPHIFGIAVGCQIILLCVALGLGQLLTQWPGALDLLRVVGALYLLYLAWQLVRSNPVQSTATQTKPFTFTQAALFQWVNPKAWMMILTGVATFTNPQDFTISVAIVAGAFLMIGLPLISSWSLFGAILKNWLTQGQRLRTFNRIMASLLVASLIPTFGLQASEDPHAAQEPVAQTQSPPQQPATPPPGQREPWWLSVM
ncbi:lysine exporter protein LysE/YggA [Alcanivorax nanhaiticus]|uniref:Lysine exporter protein LysE/YggA n=1 Tax=Alcanivorax nanhaiticus TaxID=1177154 RepID=A0A095UU25_9GAMM|nr:LysE family translocator [Alcanivorax nanhaiticus]KGD66035.1 lysine exporter protein LysE/YggA [Alcanivorax nanhaiticus]